MRFSFNDIRDAFDFVSAANAGEHQAFLCLQSGKIYWQSELVDGFDELPDDVDDDDKYIAIPDQKELGLGKPLALDFAAEVLLDDFDEVRRIFSRRGAYAGFKALLARRGALDQWYAFEAQAVERELRDWCAENSIELMD